MNQTPTYLNQYAGYDAEGNATVVVAADMETAVKVYNQDKEEDPVQMQTTKRQIRCVLPDIYVAFETETYDPTGGAATAGCRAYPSKGVVVGGDKQYFEASAKEGWRFVKWIVNGVEIEDSTAIMELTIPTITTGDKVKVRAVFEEDL